MDSRKFIILGVLALILGFIASKLIVGFKNIKVDDFRPVAAIFLLDASASNQEDLPKQKKFITQMCSVLDPEDHTKIIRISEEAYLIYEGSPHNISTINKTLNKFTAFDKKDFGTAYGTGIKKAFSYALTMQKEGYTPAIIIMGDLEAEGALSGQINWDTLPGNISKSLRYMPELSMTFLFAHPSKLDYVKGKITPVLGENKLIIATEENADKTMRKFMRAIGR